MELIIVMTIFIAFCAFALFVSYKYEKGIMSNATLFAIREDQRSRRRKYKRVSSVAKAVSSVSNASMSRVAQKCVPPCSHGKDSASTDPAPKAGHSVACMKNFGCLANKK